MNFINDFSINKLFIDKTVVVQTETFKFRVIGQPVIKFYMDDDFLLFYNFLTMTPSKIKEIFQLQEEVSNFDLIQTILFKWGQYKEYKKIYTQILNAISNIFPDFKIDFKSHFLKIDNDIITKEIWDYAVYILKLLCGEKVSQPLTFTSPEAEQLYLQAQQYEEEVNRIKNQGNNKNKDGLIKIFLAICYSFPFLTFDYLFQQTMAQIHWLQKYAAEAVSYSFNEKAFAAGNAKKNSKLNFFVK